MWLLSNHLQVISTAVITQELLRTQEHSMLLEFKELKYLRSLLASMEEACRFPVFFT